MGLHRLDDERHRLLALHREQRLEARREHVGLIVANQDLEPQDPARAGERGVAARVGGGDPRRALGIRERLADPIRCVGANEVRVRDHADAADLGGRIDRLAVRGLELPVTSATLEHVIPAIELVQRAHDRGLSAALRIALDVAQSIEGRRQVVDQRVDRVIHDALDRGGDHETGRRGERRAQRLLTVGGRDVELRDRLGLLGNRRALGHRLGVDECFERGELAAIEEQALAAVAPVVLDVAGAAQRDHVALALVAARGGGAACSWARRTPPSITCASPSDSIISVSPLSSTMPPHARAAIDLDRLDLDTAPSRLHSQGTSWPDHTSGPAVERGTQRATVPGGTVARAGAGILDLPGRPEAAQHLLHEPRAGAGSRARRCRS